MLWGGGSRGGSRGGVKRGDTGKGEGGDSWGRGDTEINGIAPLRYALLETAAIHLRAAVLGEGAVGPHSHDSGSIETTRRGDCWGGD